MTKSYSDGQPFVDGTSFDFDYGQIRPWVGPCLYLKSSVGYFARDAKCYKEYAFACEWQVPNCPTGYAHQGHLSEGRTCVSILPSGPVPNTDEMCRDPTIDQLREPFVSKSPADMELLTSLMRYKHSYYMHTHICPSVNTFFFSSSLQRTVWINGLLYSNDTWAAHNDLNIFYNPEMELDDMRYVGETWVNSIGYNNGTTGRHACKKSILNPSSMCVCMYYIFSLP